MFFRDIIKRIDQSEFEGFEYINPLLLSTEETVWRNDLVGDSVNDINLSLTTVYACEAGDWMETNDLKTNLLLKIKEENNDFGGCPLPLSDS